MVTDPNVSRKRRRRQRFAWLPDFFYELGPLQFSSGIVLVGIASVGVFATVNVDPVEGVVVDAWTEEHCSNSDLNRNPNPFPQPQPPPPQPVPDMNPFAIELDAGSFGGIDLAADCDTKLHAKVEYETSKGERTHEFTYENLDAVEVGDRVDVYQTWMGLFSSRFEAAIMLLLLIFFFGGFLIYPVIGAIWVIQWGHRRRVWRRAMR